MIKQIILLAIIATFAFGQCPYANQVVNYYGQCVCDQTQQLGFDYNTQQCVSVPFCAQFFKNSVPIDIYSCTCLDNYHVDSTGMGCEACPEGAYHHPVQWDICECASGLQPVYDSNGVLTGCGKNKCHDSCNCQLQDDGCASCNKCLTCKQPLMATMINEDYCVCNSPKYRLKEGSTWECEEVTEPKDPKCDWQLFNSITRMVVHSECSFYKDPNTHASYVVDKLTYDWARTSGIALEDECKQQMQVTIQHAKDCQNYFYFNVDYYATLTDSSVDQNKYTNIKIPLIDIYQLTSDPVVQNSNINQTLCLEILLTNTHAVLRRHRFQLRIYTNRNQVQTFHLNVTPQITNGCDNGQECIVVANLDVKGNVCESSSCSVLKPAGFKPSYVVGQHMYVRIQFIDNSYTKYLSPQRVTFVDASGIYVYEKGTQWKVLDQQPGWVDIDILLFQPQLDAVIQVNLKISTEKDSRLRALESSDDKTDVELAATIVNQQQKKQVTTATKDQSDSFSIAFVLSFISLISLLLV